MKIYLVVALVVIGAAMCASMPSEPRCKCLRTANSVEPRNILSVDMIEPSLRCNKRQVIVTLRNRTDPVCIDPNGEFFKDYLHAIIKRMAIMVARRKSKTNTPVESSTAAAKTLQTSSTLTSVTSKQE